MTYWEVVNAQTSTVTHTGLTEIEARQTAARLTRDYQTPYVAVKRGPF